MNSGCISNIQRFAVSDGPGIRTTVFFKGCGLRCQWCANPENLNPDPELMFLDTLCRPACHDCVKSCPLGAISKAGDRVSIDRLRCDGCMQCTAACPQEALKVSGRYLSINEVVEEVMRDAPFYKRSKGGVTLSGGEPMHQPEFAYEILAACRRNSVHTALDTSGDVDWPTFECVIQLTDLVLYDIKHVSPEKHRQHTGKDNARIIENARRVSETGTEMIVRFPLIPGINDDPDHILQIGAFIHSLSGRICVEILPCHRLGAWKYRALGRSPGLDPLPVATKEDLDRVKKMLDDADVPCRIHPMPGF